MAFAWSDLKDLFFVIGSIAGVVALVRPLLESKYQRDSTRIERIKSIVEEQDLVDLEHFIHQKRQVEDTYFKPFKQLSEERRSNQDVVRFTGPLAKHLCKEIDALISRYARLREYIQVNEWEPSFRICGDQTEVVYWTFSKSAFTQEDGVARDYTRHLDEAAEQAKQMKMAYQRFQLVAELHLYEVPFAKWLLPRRFKANGLREDA